MKKKITVAAMVLVLLFTFIAPAVVSISEQDAYAASNKGELRGVWVSCFDFSGLGLSNKNEKTFRTKVNAFLNKAKGDKLNAVFFHVRAHDDAAWKSKSFPAMSQLSSKAARNKSAANTYSYDPMKIVIELTHKKGMQFHAWLNPYRKDSSGTYYNPAYGSSTDRIVKAVNEIMKYDVDGIHFDDYFYSGKKYVNLKNKSVLYEKNKPSYGNRMKNVNNMVSRVYKAVKKNDSHAVFGISPQGNMDNAKNLGCDINTWMSKKGYIDYVMPQIYWTDQWGTHGKTKMFSDRLNLWTKKQSNKAKVKVYIGLASYNTGKKLKYDKGWGNKSDNLATQLKALRKSKCSGYVLFSASDLFRKGASKEISNLNKVV